MKKHLHFGVVCLLLSITTSINAQNSTCGTAAILAIDSNCGGSETGPGANAGDPTGNDDTDGNVCSSFYSDGDDFIYEYTATTEDQLVLSLWATNTWTGLLVTEGCPTVGTCFASSTSNSADETLTTPAMTINTVYYIHISTFPSPQSPGQFCLDASLMAPPMAPANDLCADAIDLVTLTSPLTATTEGANDDDLQTCAGGNTSPDIYYKIDVPDGSTLTIGQTSNGYDSENYVGYGGSCGEENEIDCYDDPDNKTVTWQNCTGSTQTVIWVQDGYSGSTNFGTFTLEWSVVAAPIPVCTTATLPADAATGVATSGDITWSSVADACSYNVYLDQNDPPTTLLGNVTDLTIPYTGLANGQTYYILIEPTNATGSATGCTTTSFETINTAPDCTTIITPADVSTGVSIDGNITFNAAAGADSYDVYLDENSIPITLLGNTATTSIAYSGLSNLTTYNVQIVPKNGIGDATGCPITSFTTVDPPPANDECSGAVVLTHEAEGSCTNTSSTLVNSTQSQAACVGSGDNDVWFSFEATATSAIIDVTGGPDIVTEVFEEGSGCSALGASIICSDPNDPTVTGLTVGNTYYIRINVWSTFTTPSAFDICVTTPAEPPLNDDCVNAEIVGMIPLDGTCIDVSGTTEAATNSGFVPSCDFAGTDYDVFYSFTAPAGGVVILEETSGTADPLEMVVLDACSGTTIDGACGIFPQTVSGLTPGTMYILDVWNDDFENPGTFDICFKVPPACTAPTVGNILIDFTNCPASATITFDVTDIGSSPPLVVSNDAGGTNPADITETGTYSITNLPTTGNMSFTLTNIDPLCNVTEGPFTLACPPTNDDVADATAITLDMGCTGDAYTNLYSNGETGEVVGSCFGSTTATNSVWFTFEAPSSGSVNITNDIVGDGTGDLTDAQLAVYSTTDPTDFTSFTEEACSEDDGSNVGLGYMNDIDVTGLTGGGTYYILIDGYGTATGDFCLEINTLCDADTKVVLPTVTTTAIAADACTDFADGFTYYDDGTGNYIFAIDWAPDGTISTANQAAKDATTVEITKYSQSGSGSGAYDAPGNSPTQSSFALLTSWNVNLGAESIDEPVDVKFYYDPAEKTAVDDAANALADPNGGTWYKNEGADYNHDPVVTPEDFQDNVTLLTDVSGGGSDNGVTYARFDGVASFSGGSYGAGAGSGLLPIKLTRFTAKQDGRQNMIEWSTASEINVEDHTLIKSDDAINWEALGVVDGEISSNSNIDYEMMDVSPFATTYYQLMTTDIDGTTSYSPIVSVTRDSERSSEFLGASPVPTRDVVNLNVYVSADDNITITLIDISGKKIFVDNRAISSGDHQLPLDLSNMTNGVYMVTITSSYIQQTHRVIKN
ncbi:MAG: T9SS type A sorting domain-containing protein [Saprospiraceae bacterium]